MIGKTLAHYEITALLGKGGMGEVYRARDTKLDREVALKLLPAELANDTERLARFHREARTLASLHHPRIASLFGIEESGDQTFLVMELVEGHDLSERLAQTGAMAIDDVVAIASQMAEGLEFAHEKGIMHRDLKPANVKLTPQGEVKILDFGLARAFTGDPIDESDLANSPTITAALTQAGVILGTAAYMSPEQAKGKSVDRRADIWSYGVVLFELLTGERLFQGETASETMADVMKGDIVWGRLPRDTPAGLRRLLERCLDRDATTRLRDIGEARIVLGQVDDEPLATASEPRPSSRVPWMVAGAAIVLAGLAVAWALGRSPRSEAPLVRTQADLLAGPGLGYDVSDIHFEISPDGRRFAFAGIDADGERWLYLRDLSTGDLRRLDGTQGATIPFWSPDGQRLGFFVADDLTIFGVDDGIIERSVVRMNSWAMDAAWHPDGSIILTSNDSGGTLHRADPTSGDVELLHDTEFQDCALSDPDVLPDGAIMYSEDYFDGREETGVYVLHDGERRQLIQHAADAHWVADLGTIVYRRQQRIFAQGFDPETMTLQGDPVRIGGPVRTKTFPNQGYLTVADDGTLLYLEGRAGANDSDLMWVDRKGTVLERLGLTGDLYGLDISADGRRVAFDNSEPDTGGDIWVYDFVRRSSVRLTDHSLDESSPVWSLDGDEIYFFRGSDLMKVELEGTPTVVELIADGTYRRPLDVDPASERLLIAKHEGDDRDLLLVDPDTGLEEMWLDLDEKQYGARFAPSGDWVAYTSDQGERNHVWVESYPGRQERFRVSSDEGGRYPQWRGDGREIFYVNTSRRLMAVPVDMNATDRRPIGTPQELFPVNLRQNAHYAADASGERFLLNQLVGEGAVPSAVLVRGWQ